MKPGKGAQIARSAGTVAQIVAMEGDYATLRLNLARQEKYSRHAGLLSAKLETAVNQSSEAWESRRKKMAWHQTDCAVLP